MEKMLKQLQFYIIEISKTEDFINYEEKTINLYNSILKIYNYLDIFFDMYDYNLKNIPQDKFESFKNNYNLYIKDLSFDMSLIKKYNISHNMIHEVLNLYKKA